MTPQGRCDRSAARGATPLDFAYHLHTDLGHRCRGAKVNGRIVPLNHALANGDVVEIITGKQDAPSRDWLSAEQGYLALTPQPRQGASLVSRASMSPSTARPAARPSSASSRARVPGRSCWRRWCASCMHRAPRTCSV